MPSASAAPNTSQVTEYQPSKVIAIRILASLAPVLPNENWMIRLKLFPIVAAADYQMFVIVK
jgi:hypothetical protein